MLMNSLLLVVVGHALKIAVLIDCLHNLINISFDILPDGLQLLKGLPDLIGLDLADLVGPFRLFVQEVEVLVSHIF